MRILLLVLTATLCLLLRPGADAPETVLLWPKGAPGAKGTADSDQPRVDVYLPQGQKPTAGVVICPGGAYVSLALGHEGSEIAEWLNGLGVAAFVLHYRLHSGGYSHPIPLQDAQRALRLVRSRAAQYGYPADHVGILGFSAGGHLASSAGTHFDRGDSASADAVERQSSRPDFMVLAYPVITFTGEFAHRGSVNSLLGDKPDPKLVESLSNQTQVTKDTPPTFLMHTQEDRGVLPGNSLLFYAALLKNGVPAELHIYEQGPHGVGLGKKYPGVSHWSEACADWMRLHGWVKNSKQ